MEADPATPERAKPPGSATFAIATNLFLLGGIALVAWMFAPLDYWRDHHDD